MWIGVVNVIVAVETDAICLTSAVGRSSRENQLPALPGVVGNASVAKSSTKGMAGLSLRQTTRQSGEAQICPRPWGSACQLAPDASSSRTNWPGVNPAALSTVTVYVPLMASATKLVPTTSAACFVGAYRDGPTIISGAGLAP